MTQAGAGSCPKCQTPLKRVKDSSLASCPGCNATFVPVNAKQVSLLTRLGDGPAAPVASIDLPREFTARWRLGELLGAGAMGTVYRAEEIETGRVVAIKFLTRIDDPGVLARFINEGRMLQTLRHPCIITVYEVQHVDAFPYLVTEYVEGGTLRTLLERNRSLSVDLACSLMIQCLDALQACHAQGIVHRDLKPENVLVTSHGAVRLADLGIAKKYGDQRGLSGTEDTGAEKRPRNAARTMIGALIGTPRYMAPEQVRGEPAVVASDLHAAGALLYEMLCGSPPFSGQTLPELLHQIETEVPPDIGRRVFGLSPMLATLVTRALSKRIAERPRSAEEMAIVLRKVATPGAVTSRAPVVQKPPLRPGALHVAVRAAPEDRERLKFATDEAPVIKMRDRLPAQGAEARPMTDHERAMAAAMPPVSQQARDRIASAKPPAPPQHPRHGAAWNDPFAHPPAKTPGAKEAPSDQAVKATALAAVPPSPAQAKVAAEEQRLRAELKRLPADVQAHLALGQFLERQDRLAEAETCYRTAIQRAPRHATAQGYLGIVLARQGKADKAEQRLRGAIGADPRAGWIHLALGDLLLSEGRAPAATAAYRLGLERDPDSTALRYRVIVALRDSDPPAARQVLAELLSSEPKNGWARRQHDELAGTRKPLGTLADCRAISTAYPTDGGAHFDLARALERANRPAEARTEYQAATADPAYAWATYDIERIDGLEWR